MPAKTTVNPIPAAAGTQSRRVVLASTSRYRKMLLQRLGIAFVTVAPGTDETALAGETPAGTAFRLAEAKARSVAHLYADALIIGSDQVADCGGRPIGKPGNHERAVAQLTGSLPAHGTGKDKVTPQFMVDVSLSRVARDPEPKLAVRVRVKE